ncbi:MAG: hypothetical protein ACF8OB_03755 [Phycisphaeraceae bacterium JB051]
MTSKQKQNVNQHNHGMSNAAVLIIGVLVGLLGAGAFIYVAKQSETKKPATVATTEQTTPVAGQGDTAQVYDKAIDSVSDNQDATADTVKQEKQAAPLTPEEVKQVQQVKKILDQAIANETQKVVAAVKATNDISAGKNLMALEQAKLQELSSKVKVVIDAETNFITALQNVDDALVKLVNKTSLSAQNKLRVARGYMYNLSMETALPFRKANLERWMAYQKFVDFLANNYGKWEFEAEKNNTKLLDESLNEELKTTVENLNIASKALKVAEAKHVQVIRTRINQLQQARQAAQQVGTNAAPDAAATPAATDKPAESDKAQ